MKKLMKKAAKNFTESCDTIYNKNRGTLWASVTTYMPEGRAEALIWTERRFIQYEEDDEERS